MLMDTIFRKGGERKPSHDELRSLLSHARSERAALRTMLDQALGVTAKLAKQSKAIDELGARTEGVMQQVEKLAGLAASYDDRMRSVDQLEARVAELLQQVAEVKRTSQADTAPDGNLQQHRQTIDELNAQAREAQSTLDTLRGENERLAQLRTQLHETSIEVRQSVTGARTLKGELDELRAYKAELRLDMQGLREIARDAHSDSVSAKTAVQDVATKLTHFAQLQELSKDTEKRLASLNALAEHVLHKAKALETQKHTVERAVLEATRLNEMVWTMDAQIAKLNDGRDQMQRAEEAVSRMEALALSTTQDLASASAAREEFLRESSRLEGQGRSLAEHLRSTIEKLSVDKREFDAFDERLKSLSAAMGQTEVRVQDVLAKDEALSAMQQQAEALGKTFATLRAETEVLARKQDGLDVLAEQLAEVDALGKRTAVQHERLMQSQQELKAAREELVEFHKAHAEALQLRDKLAMDRTALESFAERTTTMLGRTPDLEARLDSVLGKMVLVEEGNRAAARLADVAGQLDTQLTRVGARLQFVEKLDERVNGLHLVTSEIERKVADQLARRAEIEGMKSLCDTLADQVAYTQQKLHGVAALQVRLQPVSAQVTGLMQTLEKSQQLVDAMKKDEAVVQEQQMRLAELVEMGRKQAAETAERLKQVQSVSEDLGRAAAVKEELLAELAQLQAKQRDAIAQIDVAEDQLKRAEAMARQIEQRRGQLQQTEKVLAAFEGRLGELGRSAEAVDQKIQSLADRDALVQAVKAEVC